MGDFVIEQPYVYRRAELAEPDWTRFPGWAQVTRAEWESAQWQRAHCVKNIRQLRQVLGAGLAEEFCADLERDQRERATMSMLVPPQMLNTMAPATPAGAPEFTERARPIVVPAAPRREVTRFAVRRQCDPAPALPRAWPACCTGTRR